MELLLLSSSRTPAGYFTDYLPEVRDFVGRIRRAYFVPFAAVGMAWDQYARMAGEALGLAMDGDLETAELIVVGGGNTFQLLRECRARGLLKQISGKVRDGTRYLGWSAGANLACPTIRTTNDMPIVDPGGLDALALIPFQINPHYLNVALPGHHGETRDQRLAEFARVNPEVPVLGLPEGDWLRVASHEMRGASIELRGPHPAAWFEGDAPPARLAPGWRFRGSA
jgi:dipeptidase E